MNSDKIADLYSSGDISGYVYLACVENDIYTVGDAVEKGVFSNPKFEWAKPLLAFIDTPEAPAENSVLNQEQNRPVPVAVPIDVRIRLEKVFNELLIGVDVRTASAIKVCRDKEPSIELFLNRFFYDKEFWVQFGSLHSVGRKTIKRAKEFAREVENKLNRRGIVLSEILAQQEDNATTPSEPAENEDQLKNVIQLALSELSVRPKNALKLLLLDFDDSYLEFYRHINSPSFDIGSIRNVGRKSLPEIKQFINRVNQLVKESVQPEVEESGVVQAQINLDEYQTFFEAKLSELSNRSYHAISALYDKCGRSVQKFMDTVSRSDFRVSSLPSIGRKSTGEILFWLNSIRTVFQEDMLGANKEETTNKIRLLAIQQQGLVGDTSVIDEKSIQINHFAYFCAIQQYLNSLSKRDLEIVNSQLKIYLGQALLNKKESAKKLNLSQERIRQIRNTVFNKLRAYIVWMKNAVVSHLYPQYMYSIAVIPLINKSEGTSFSDNFIYWAMSLLWPDNYVLLGDPVSSFTNPYGYEINLALVPKDLFSIFDFTAFIQYFERLQEEKRVDNLSIPIKECLLQFFRNRVYYEKMEDIESYCRDIARTILGFEVSSDAIHVEKNASRNNSEWVEIIIREIGHPIALDEIFAELEKRHPGKSKSSIALSGAIRMNPNIVPIGRSSTYGLKEWSDGAQRGGTIREFATEYLLSLEKPIATLAEIAKYVRKFRPTSSDKSIHANLLLEANGAFQIFYKGNDRYIGLANYEYGDEYRPFDRNKDAKRDFKTSCTLLEEFVAEKGRLPFSNNVDEEEKRLARFWNVQLSHLEKGELREDERAIIEAMSQKFNGLKINKKDYDWRNKIEEIERIIENGNGVSSLTPETQTWLTKQVQAYKTEKLSLPHMQIIEKLINKLKKDVN